MRDNLDRSAQIIALPLPFNDMLINLSSRGVVFASQGDVGMPFVVSEVKINFTAIDTSPCLYDKSH